MQNNKNNLRCIAHRGAMGYEPENTLKSFEKAIELGATSIELDVFYVENHLLVIHDALLERTTNGTGFIQEKSYEYLRSLDAGKGQQIPTLNEVCELVDKRACINIELKEKGTAKPVSHLINKLIKQGWDKNHFLVSSFIHQELIAFQQLNPAIKIGALIETLLIKKAEFAQKMGAYSVNPSIEIITKDFVEDAHQRGLKVFVYVVNQPDEIEKMQKMGVDGVFTNYPDRVLKNQYQKPIWI